jgi:hypothetical protein
VFRVKGFESQRPAWILGFSVRCSVFRVQVLGFRVWDIYRCGLHGLLDHFLGFRVSGFGFGIFTAAACTGCSTDPVHEKFCLLREVDIDHIFEERNVHLEPGFRIYYWV